MIFQIFNIIFSIILLPVNICCAFWIFREALNLCGITTREFLGLTAHKTFPSNRQRGLAKRQRFLVRFFQENSVDPDRSVRLLWTFGVCTLPGLAALTLALYAARNADGGMVVFIGNLALLLVNIVLACAKDIYRRRRPLDEKTAEMLKAKRDKEKKEGGKTRRRNGIVYTLVGAFFFAVLLGFYLGAAGASGVQPESIGHQVVNTVLHEKGFETANIPTTFWIYDENKLANVCAGVKGETKFEFYEYTDGETTDLVYNSIITDIAQDMEPDERAQHETALPAGNKMFTAAVGGVYHLVLYQGDTVVYGCSPGAITEINDILFAIGYLKEK